MTDPRTLREQYWAEWEAIYNRRIKDGFTRIAAEEWADDHISDLYGSDDE